MKTEQLLPPTFILDTYKDKDDLLFYLRTKFESPSIELYINGHGEVVGFTCVSSDGTIYTTLKAPAMVVKHNAMAERNKVRNDINLFMQDMVKRVEKSNFYLKAACGFLIIFSSWLFIQQHRQKNTIEKLKTELSKPKLIQDTI